MIVNCPGWGCLSDWFAVRACFALPHIALLFFAQLNEAHSGLPEDSATRNYRWSVFVFAPLHPSISQRSLRFAVANCALPTAVTTADWLQSGFFLSLAEAVFGLCVLSANSLDCRCAMCAKLHPGAIRLWGEGSLGRRPEGWRLKKAKYMCADCGLPQRNFGIPTDKLVFRNIEGVVETVLLLFPSNHRIESIH